MMHFMRIVVIFSICYAINGYEVKINDDFSCDSEDPIKFYVKGLPFECPAKKICNLLYISGSTFCIDQPGEMKDMCKKIYTCDDNKPDHASVSGVDLKCDTYNECNFAFNWPCQLCVHTKCTDATFSCSADLTSFQYPNMPEIRCEEGYVCNKEKLCPAEPCIKSDQIGEVTTEGGNQDKCEAPDVLNCNDGYADSYPCRRAPLGSNVYFKCYKSWLWYDYELKKCSDLQNDLTCKDVECICH